MADNLLKFRNDKEATFRKFNKRKHTKEEEIECFKRFRAGDKLARDSLNVFAFCSYLSFLFGNPALTVGDKKIFPNCVI